MFLFLSPSAFFGLPLFLFLFLCISLALVLFFLSSLSFFFFLLVHYFSLFLIFLYYLLLFSEKNNMQFLNCNLFIHQYFLFFMVSCLVFLFQIAFSYLCFFPGIQLCFLFNINVFGFKKHKLRNTNFWSRGELQQNGFFNNLCLKNVKSYRFLLPFFGQILVAVQKTLQK